MLPTSVQVIVFLQEQRQTQISNKCKLHFKLLQNVLLVHFQDLVLIANS